MEIKILRRNKDVLKKGWVIYLDSDELVSEHGTFLWKVIDVSEFSARIVPLKSIAFYEYDTVEDMERFYNTLRLTHISAKSEVDVVAIHRTNLELG